MRMIVNEHLWVPWVSGTGVLHSERSLYSVLIGLDIMLDWAEDFTANAPDGALGPTTGP